MKKTINKLALATLALSAFLVTSCEDIWNDCIDGNGYRRIEDRNLNEYDRVEINGDFEVQVDTGNEYKATIEADENLMDLIITHVSNRTLIIETRNHTCIKPTHPIEITISAQTLKEVTLNGSGLIYCYGLESEEFAMNLSGSGQIDITDLVVSSLNIDLEGSGNVNTEVIADNINTELEGSGQIKLNGISINSDHKIVGSGNIKAGQLVTDICNVYITGSGVVDAHVNDALDATIIGSGIVYYTGNPEIESYISGSGQVRER